MDDKSLDYLMYCKDIHDIRLNDVLKEINTYKSNSFKAVMEMGRIAVKASLYVQCGAVLAVLAFFSNNLMEIIKKEITTSLFLGMYVESMYVWCCGICSCVIAYGTTYLSQYYDYGNYCNHSEELKHAVINVKSYAIPNNKKMSVFQSISVLLVFLSYVTMIVGFVYAARGMNLLLS